MNVVNESCGAGGATITLNVQTASLASASIPWHETVVVPRSNGCPEGGVHVSDTGGLPPTIVGLG
jgi:hypothetical protein